MIICNISQFSCLFNINEISQDELMAYQLTPDEITFIQLIHDYQSRENDNKLPRIVQQYEALLGNIDVTRLVILKVLYYQPNIKPLQIDPSRLQNLPALPKRHIVEAQIDPILRFLSGNFDN